MWLEVLLWLLKLVCVVVFIIGVRGAVLGLDRVVNLPLWCHMVLGTGLVFGGGWLILL